jgi:hypothetical protein
MLVVERTERREDADRHALEPARQVREPAERRRVAPLHVVDRKQDRPRLRQVDRQPVEPVQKRIDVLLAAPVARAGAEQARGLPRRAAEQPRPLLAGRGGDRRLEQLPDDAEGERASSSLARAESTDRPDAAARARPAARSDVFPIRRAPRSRSASARPRSPSRPPPAPPHARAGPTLVRSHALDLRPKSCGFSYGASTSRPHPHRSDLLAMHSTREKETTMHHRTAPRTQPPTTPTRRPGGSCRCSWSRS